MPTKATVFRWLGDARYSSFRDQYARAMESRADSMADDITDISDDAKLDPNDKRVRIDARKWLAGKLRPKKYGDKSAVEVTGANGGPVQAMMLDPEKLKTMTTDELAVLESAIGKLQRGADGSAGGAPASADERSYQAAIDGSEGELAT